MDDGGFRWDQIPIQLYLIAAGVAVVLIVIAAVVTGVLWRRARRSSAWRTAKLRLQAELDPSPARGPWRTYKWNSTRRYVRPPSPSSS